MSVAMPLERAAVGEEGEKGTLAIAIVGLSTLTSFFSWGSGLK